MLSLNHAMQTKPYDNYTVTNWLYFAELYVADFEVKMNAKILLVKIYHNHKIVN